MRIISFAWTTPALLARRKTVTRREWTPEYAAGFHPGDLVAAYNRSPRNGGRQVAVLRIQSVILESTIVMPDSDYEAEGFVYLAGRRIGKHDASWEGFRQWRNDDEDMWVIRFDVVEIFEVHAVPTSQPLLGYPSC